MSSDLPEQPEEEVEPVDETDIAQPELSLDQLSQAYAQVMKEQGLVPDGLDESEQEESDGEYADEDLADHEQPAEKKQIELRPEKSLDEIDAEDNAPCPISPKSIVEAVLFVGAPTGVKLTGRKLAAVMRDVSPKEVKKIVKELNKEYDREKNAFHIVEDSGDYKLKLRDDFIDVQNFFFGRNRPARLSQNAIDVLAIVAYNQPVSRNKVDKIRLKPSGGVLNQLVKRDLIVVSEDSKPKEALFETTDRFLELFGLGALEDLPQTSVVSDLEELTDQ